MLNKKETGLVIVADVGGTHIRLGAADIVTEQPVSKSLNINTSILALSKNPITEFAEIIKSFQKELKAQIVGLVIGLPASFDEKMDVVIRCNNLPSIVGLPFASGLEKILGFPVILEHDLMLHLLGETSILDCSDKPTSAGIYFGTGIGCDVLLHDEPYRPNKVSFELGHIPYKIGGKKCVCGMKGCMEAYSNGHRLVSLAKKYNIDISELFKEWDNGSAPDKVLHEIVNVQAMCISTISMIFTPKYIILGGGIVNMKGFPKDYLINAVKDHILSPYPRNSVNIIWASLGDKAAVIGGVRDLKKRK